MSDSDKINDLVKIASDGSLLLDIEHKAARLLLNYDGEQYPHDGCAITLSLLLRQAGIDVPETFQAIRLARILVERGWARVSTGSQQKGDIGTTCSKTPNHGSDHIYLVLKALNPDEMVIADNQDPQPHLRYASGIGGKTPTRYFLRAPGYEEIKPALAAAVG